jgi:hypothetical protein
MSARKSGTSLVPQVSDSTRVRVLSRIEAANRPYVAHRRDFSTPAQVRVSKIKRALRKALPWKTA